MKHIKKYKLFESEDTDKFDDFYKSCKDIFGYLIDDGYVVEILKKSEYLDSKNDLEEDEVRIYISKSIIKNDDITSFEQYFNKHKRWSELLDDINISLKRIKDEYNDIEISFSDHEEDDEFYIEINRGKVKKGEFYKLNGKYLKININQLKKILGLKDVEIDTSTDGENYFLSFNFKNKEDLDSNIDDLIKNFQKLIINDEQLNKPGKFGYNTSSGDIIKSYVIYRDYNQTYYTRNGKQSKIVNLIKFSLNPKFEYFD